jgi:hypothetical protein
MRATVFLTMVTVIAGCAMGAAEPPGKMPFLSVSSIEAGNRDSVNDAFDGIREDLLSLEKEILEIIGDPQRFLPERRFVVVHAIQAAGLLRSQRAVGTLIKMADFPVLEESSDEYRIITQVRHIPKYSRFPALYSLVQIGNWRAVLIALGSEKDAHRRELLVKVVKEILGKDLADRALELAIENEAVADAKANLQHAREVLATINW